MVGSLCHFGSIIHSSGPSLEKFKSTATGFITLQQHVAEMEKEHWSVFVNEPYRLWDGEADIAFQAA